MSMQFDFLGLGGGVAGLTFALKLPIRTVLVLTKAPEEGNSQYAQGVLLPFCRL